MTGMKRAGASLLVLVLVGGAGASLRAQIPGMPLFTNPRYGTGLRLHADAGQPTESVGSGTSSVDLTVVQGGLSLAIGPVGLNAMVGMNLRDAQSCTGTGCDIDATGSAAALAQIRLAGGGGQNLSLSVFGGASGDINGYDIAGIPQPKQLTIPVGASVGLRIPLGVASLNLWGAPRMNLTKYVDCDPSNQGLCDENFSNFRWAVGADLPIFRVLSVRAAFDSGKLDNQTISYVGVGASIGIGGMR